MMKKSLNKYQDQHSTKPVTDYNNDELKTQTIKAMVWQILVAYVITVL